MGRKIPGKKHRTVKDPYKQNEKRLESLRLKVNNPPSNPNEQEIPRSLLKIMELKKQAKLIVNKEPNSNKNRNRNRNRKRKGKEQILLSVAKLRDKEPFLKGTKNPDKPIPNLVQKPNESATSFLRRVNSMTQNLINEVEFERKFGVEIKKNLETGEVVEVKKIKNKSKSKKKKLALKRKEKLDLKKENLKNIKDFSQFKDNVKFGEVVHRPPDFSKIKIVHSTKKPNFSNLILTNAVQNTQMKSKNLQSIFEKEKKENERKFIVEAYRKLKKKIN